MHLEDLTEELETLQSEYDWIERNSMEDEPDRLGELLEQINLLRRQVKMALRLRDAFADGDERHIRKLQPYKLREPVIPLDLPSARSKLHVVPALSSPAPEQSSPKVESETPQDPIKSSTELLAALKATTVPKKRIEILCQLAHQYRALGHIKLEFHSLMRALLHAPADPGMNVKIASFYFSIGDEEHAFVYYKRALDLGWKGIEEYCFVANYLLYEGKNNEAAKYTLDAFHLGPQTPEELYYLGKLLVRQGEIVRAKQCLEQIRESPGLQFYEEAQSLLASIKKDSFHSSP
jgi:tetratricopeptide (TPR) repeat protein